MDNDSDGDTIADSGELVGDADSERRFDFLGSAIDQKRWIAQSVTD